MASRITIKDRGYARLAQRLRASGKPALTVGVHEDDGAEPHGQDGTTVAEVAAANEFGLGVPERSFIRSTLDENDAKYKELERRIGKAVVLGKLESVEQGLEQLGALVVGDVQRKISSGVPPENAPSTVAAKGSSTTLVDTGQMRASVTSRVRR